MNISKYDVVSGRWVLGYYVGTKFIVLASYPASHTSAALKEVA